MIHWTRRTWQIYLELCIPKQQNIFSSRVHMELSPRYITYWVTTQSLINIKIIPHTLSGHNARKLEINRKKKSGKPPKARTLKDTLLKNERVNQAIREGTEKYMETNENENATIQMLWDAAKQYWEENTLQSRPISRNKKNPKYKNLKDT